MQGSMRDRWSGILIGPGDGAAGRAAMACRIFLLSAKNDRSAPHAAAAGAEQRPSASRYRILLVEDELFIALDSETMLKDAGYEVVDVATTTEQAIALADRHRPDLVLMDIRLGGAGDGIEAATEILRRTGIGSLFISAYGDPVTRSRARIAEPLGWLSKPFSAAQLLAAVSDALHAARLRRL